MVESGLEGPLETESGPRHLFRWRGLKKLLLNRSDAGFGRGFGFAF